MAQILMVGYFGEGNLGDDAMLAAVGNILISRGNGVHVLSGNPDDTARNYGFQTYNRMNPKLVKEAINMCDMVVFPGGSIFQDVTSIKSVKYYQQIVAWAKAAKKPVVMVGQGIGPLNTFFGKRIAKSAFDAADLIAVRDPGSVVTLKKLGITKRVQVTADPAFLLQPPQQEENQVDFALAGMRTVGISPRPFAKRKDMPQLFGELSRRMFEANYNPVLIEMDVTLDGPLINEISKTQGGKVPDLRKLGSATQVQRRMARMEAVIAMRLHAGILASTVGVPCLMLSYDPKVTELAKLLKIGPSIDIEKVTAEQIFNTFIEWIKKKDENQKILNARVRELQTLAFKNIELIEQSMRPKK